MANEIFTHQPSAFSTRHTDLPESGKPFYDWWRARLRTLPRFGVLQAPASKTPAPCWFHHERDMMGWDLTIRTIDDTRFVIRIR